MMVFKCLVGLFIYWQGELIIDVQFLEYEISCECCCQVQMVFQDFYGLLYFCYIIGDIFEELLQIYCINDCDWWINVLLDKVGFNCVFCECYLYQFFGGQWQCVVIVRVLIFEFQVLLLDELMLVLDVLVQVEIFNLLVELQWEVKFIYLMVIYDFGVIVYLCQKVVVMQYGKIFEILMVDVLVSGQVQMVYMQMLVNVSW